MTYNEFKNTYKWIINQAPDVTALYDRDEVEIEMTTTTYTKRGRKWAEIETKTETINPIFYLNIVDAVPFFRGLGGHCRIIKAYTKHGLIPIENVSINPDKSKKIVRTFKF